MEHGAWQVTQTRRVEGESDTVPVPRRGRARAARARRHGQALVELSLILPVLLLLGLASVDFGRAYFAGLAVMQGAREAARFAAGSTGSSPPTETQAKQRAVDAAASDFPVESATNVGAALSTSDVTITVRNDSGSAVAYTARASGYSVEVEVKGFVPFLTGFLAEGVDGFAPGLKLCIGSGSSKRCGITVTGQAYMIVL